MTSTPPTQMSFLQHLDELRSRLLRAIIGVVVAFALGTLFHSERIGLLAPR